MCAKTLQFFFSFMFSATIAGFEEKKRPLYANNDVPLDDQKVQEKKTPHK